MLNGVVHRDWMQHDPVEVTPFTTASRLTGILQREIPEVEEALDTAADCLTGTEPLLVRNKDVWTLSRDAAAVRGERRFLPGLKAGISTPRF